MGNHDFNNAISHDQYMQSLKDYHNPTAAIMLRLLGATIVPMHETIRIMSMCHWSSSLDV